MQTCTSNYGFTDSLILDNGEGWPNFGTSTYYTDLPRTVDALYGTPANNISFLNTLTVTAGAQPVWMLPNLTVSAGQINTDPGGLALLPGTTTRVLYTKQMRISLGAACANPVWFGLMPGASNVVMGASAANASGFSTAALLCNGPPYSYGSVAAYLLFATAPAGQAGMVAYNHGLWTSDYAINTQSAAFASSGVLTSRTMTLLAGGASLADVALYPVASPLAVDSGTVGSGFNTTLSGKGCVQPGLNKSALPFNSMVASPDGLVVFALTPGWLW